jgi:ubiquinone/menaquinone biosynthesis C-methylase UbiE
MAPQLPNENIKQPFPQSLLPSLRTIEFVCPLCRGELSVKVQGYRCSACKKEYTLQGGIPDFRVFPDPFLSYCEDYDRTEIVLEALEKFNLEELLEYYWSYSDITPAALRTKFIRSAILGEQRALRTLEILENNLKKPVKKVLEIGSGTGNFLVTAVLAYEQVVGIDIAMRWLQVSRRRFMDKGLPVPPLVCCCAEFLPFADDSFNLIVTSSTLEFVSDQSKVLSECARTLKEKGYLYINSVNRYALGKDPYSYLWGVGFLPRKWQARYVYWRRSAAYESIKTVSYQQLKQMAEKHFLIKQFALPTVSPLVLKEFSRITRFQIEVYQFLKRISVFTVFFKWFGPGWDLILQLSTNRVKSKKS